MSQLKRGLDKVEADDEEDETPLFSSSDTGSEEEEDGHDEGSSLHRSLRDGNIGRNLLLKMGWKEGSGLGLGGFGRVDPVPISEKRGSDLTGIGKSSLDSRTVAISTAQRRALESERQMKETDAEKDQRMLAVEMKQARKEDVTQALQTYRCDLCQKQYDRPSTFESHLNSYDHHHKKRFAEMKAALKGKNETAGQLDKRREKERRREEKEMAKLAQAAGIQLSTPSTSSFSATAPATSRQAASKVTGGWKRVGSFGNVSDHSTSHKCPTVVKSISSITTTGAAAAKSTTTTDVTPSQSGWKRIVSTPQSANSISSGNQDRQERTAPAFHSGGFKQLSADQHLSKLDSSPPPLPLLTPPPPPPSAPPPLPPPSSS